MRIYNDDDYKLGMIDYKGKIYVMKTNGDIFLFDLDTLEEKLVVDNAAKHQVVRAANTALLDYKMFVSDKEVCLLQASPHVESGRYVSVHNLDGIMKYRINLDLWDFGLSEDESLTIFTNRAVLSVANSQTVLLFHVRNGRHLGSLPIQNMSGLGKAEEFCGKTPAGLKPGLARINFEQDELIIVHDADRTFPAVIDIYKFW